MISATSAVSTAKFAIVAALVTFALVMFNKQQTDARNVRDTLLTTSAEKVSAQARSQELENSNVVLQSALEMMEESAAEYRIAVEELVESNAEARIEADARKQVFEDHDLQTIANKRMQTIERLSNAATKERFDELESLFND
jgi:hypothetical protein